MLQRRWTCRPGVVALWHWANRNYRPVTSGGSAAVEKAKKYMQKSPEPELHEGAEIRGREVMR
jgi:hypothetical protein